MRIIKLIKNLVAYVLFSFPDRFICHVFFYYIKDHNRIKDQSQRLFVLDSERLREDLDILGNSTSIEFIDFSYKLQDKIVAILERVIGSSDKDKLEFHLGKYIEQFCDIYKVNGFISAGMWYKRHEPWEIASINIGKVFYCLHREGVGVDKEFLKRSLPNHISVCRKFRGTKVFVGTDILKNMIVSGNYLPADKVVVTGLPRFDKVFHNIKNIKSVKNNNPKTILLFSFFVATMRDYGDTGLYPDNDGFRNLFDDVHAGLAQYAIDNSHVNVIIKMKWYSGKAKNNVDRIIKKKTGMAAENIDNLSILDNCPAQELIDSSDVVLSFNSTTIVESIFYRKNVIVPVFHEAIDKYPDDVSYAEYKDVFYRANSLIDMIEKIGKCIDKSMPLLAINHKFIDEMAGFYDGQICKRIENEILMK